MTTEISVMYGSEKVKGTAPSTGTPAIFAEVSSILIKLHIRTSNPRLYHLIPGLGSITSDDYDYDYDYMSFLFIDYDYDYDYSSL